MRRRSSTLLLLLLLSLLLSLLLFNRFAHSARPGTETQHSELDAASSTQRVGCSASWGHLGAFWIPLGASGGLLGGDSQAAVDLCFRCSPRGCRGFLALFWGGFWHRFLLLSRRVAFRLQMLSSGLSWLFVARFGTHFGRCFKLFSSTF